MAAKISPEDAPRFAFEQVAAFRLARHHLTARAPVSSMARVAGDMGGVQAQVMSAAQMSLWTRTRGLRAEDVDRALWQDRTLAKVWCMRGTVHLVPATDHGVFVRGCRRRAERDTRWMVQHGRPVELIDRILETIGTILDRPLTRSEVAARLGESHGPTKRIRSGGGWGRKGVVDVLEVEGARMSVRGLLGIACARGIACSGPPQGNQATFVRPDAWLHGWRDIPVDEAETQLLRRYLRAHGPATVADFAWWTYVTASDARAIWHRLESELAPVLVDGRSAFVLQEDLPALRRAKIDRPCVCLLPFFDSFLLGHKDKGHLVDAKHYKRVYRPQGWLSPVLLVDGRVAGVWSHERNGGKLAVRIEPFRPLSSEVRLRVQEEVEDLHRFLGSDAVTLSFRGSARRAAS